MITGIEQYHLERAGYFIRRGVLDPQRIGACQLAVDRIVTKCRSGEYSNVRWIDSEEDDLWGVNHIYHPAIREAALVELLASPGILEPLIGALGANTRYHLATLLVNPERKRYQIAWHRDSGPDLDAPEAAQCAHLARWQGHLQLNAALLCDACLTVVPGTHIAPLTPDQLAAFRADRYGSVPGEVRVRLNPGDVVFYNSNLFHRGECESETPRKTFHAAVVALSQPEQPIVAQPWLAEPEFMSSVSERLRPLVERFNDLAGREGNPA